MKPVASLTGEDAILACLDSFFPRVHPSLLHGRGDDCAVLRAGTPLCLSTDLFVENVHFRRSYYSPEETGHKALAVNLSDLAACGAKPLAFSLGLGLPHDVDMDYLKGLFSGMSALAGRFRMALAGGDISRCSSLCIAITLWGEVGDGSWLMRGNVQPGETLFMLGRPGLARIGLDALERHGREAIKQWPAACAAHLAPQPQVDAGQIMARLGPAGPLPALMDVSDGLARDLPRLLGANGPGAELLIPEAMLHRELVNYARRAQKNPVREAYLGGEDYALLGACSNSLLSALHSALPDLFEIGVVSEKPGIRLNGVQIQEGELPGFDHFDTGSQPDW